MLWMLGADGYGGLGLCLAGGTGIEAGRVQCHGSHTRAQARGLTAAGKEVEAGACVRVCCIYMLDSI